MKSRARDALIVLLPQAHRLCKSAAGRAVLAAALCLPGSARAADDFVPPPPPPTDSAPTPPPMSAFDAPAAPPRQPTLDVPPPAAPPAPPAPTAAPAPAPIAPALPAIEAKTYSLHFVRKSKSDKVYLFQNPPGGALPKIGRLLLIKDAAGTPIIAVRAVKNYAEKDQFAGKKLRVYPAAATLGPEQALQALEKISDVVPPPLSAQDKKDLQEVEDLPPPPSDTPAASADPALPAGAPPPPPVEADNAAAADPATNPAAAPPANDSPAGADASANDGPPGTGAADDSGRGARGAKPANPPLDESEEEENYNGMSVEEASPIDPHRNWLSAGVAYIGNNGLNPPDANGVQTAPLIPTSYYAAAGVKYGYSILKNVFTRGTGGEDSIALEGGFYYYKVAGFKNLQRASDNFDVFTFSGTVRYTYFFSENFGLFAYAGVLQNNAFATAGDPTDPELPDSIAKLSMFVPAGGGGMIFRLGPQWDIRADLGYDMSGLSIMLRF